MMNLNNISIKIHGVGPGRPTVSLIRIFRDFHGCSLTQAKEVVEDVFPVTDDDLAYPSIMRVNLLGDDQALGRLAHLVHSSSMFSFELIDRLNFHGAALKAKGWLS